MKNLSIEILEMGVASTLTFMFVVAFAPGEILRASVITFVWACVNVVLLFMPVIILVIRIFALRKV
nr:MAG TPA: hypothetical protein [Caudoviricetes sp.]